MEYSKETIIGNATTILMFVFSTIGGGAIINWLGGTTQAPIIIGACLGLAYSILNAYFPNRLSIFNNNKECSCESQSCDVNEEIDDEDGC